jgi:hypothetical protein
MFFKRTQVEFRAVPRGVRAAIYIGGSMLAVLLVFAITVWPTLTRPEPEPEEPRRETVAEAIERLDNWTQGNVTPDDVPDLIEDISEQVGRAENNQELSKLYILKFKVYFNAGQYYDAAIVGNEAVDKGVLEGSDRFTVYSGLVFAYDQMGDKAQRRRFAQLAVDEYENGTVEDNGQMQYYISVALGII